MARKEIRLDYDKISNPETITQVNEKAFKQAGLDMHKHEVDELINDDSKKQRILKVRYRKFFGPWGHRG